MVFYLTFSVSLPSEQFLVVPTFGKRKGPFHGQSHRRPKQKPPLRFLCVFFATSRSVSRQFRPFGPTGNTNKGKRIGPGR